MVDYTDDWMEPRRSSGFTIKTPEKGVIDYLIERKKAIPVSGNVSHITQWATWSSHKTAEERDAALKALSDEYPMWHLRARDRNAWNEHHGIFPPTSHPGINRRA